MEIQDLPPEILDHIFKFLSSEDRKNIRLVCQLWYDINCNREEKMIIRVGTDVEEITNIQEILEHCRFTRLNLEFQGIDMNLFSQTFWPTCGSKIHSLKFYKCLLGDETIRNMILSCHNLQHLRLHILLKYKELAFCSPIVLEEFVGANVINKQLKTLELNISMMKFVPGQTTSSGYDDYMALLINELLQGRGFNIQPMYQLLLQRIIDAIYQIYPCILNFGSGRFFATGELEGEDSSTDVCKFSRESLPSGIDVASIYSRIAFSLFAQDERIFELLAHELNALRLTSIELKLEICTETHRDLVRKFFTDHKELKSVRVEFYKERDTEFLKELLLYILNTCSGLEELAYTSRELADAPLSSETELIWLQSKFKNLKRLSIHQFLTSHIPGISMTSYSSTYPVLSTLHIVVDPMKNLFNAQNYTYLQHLTIFQVTDQILQNIFQYLTDLRTLIVKQAPCRCTEFGFTGRRHSVPERTFTADRSVKRHRGASELFTNTGYSIRRLERLENLEIQGGLDFSNETYTSEFIFPNLRYFMCTPEPGTKFSENSLVQMATHMPSLRRISFNVDDIRTNFASYADLLTFLKRAKNLHHLDLSHADFGKSIRSTYWKSVDVKIRNMFYSCSTLRYITDGVYTFHIDPFTKKMARRPRRLTEF